MANCTECIKKTMMTGSKVMFFCDVDEDITEEKMNSQHNCESFKEDRAFNVGEKVPHVFHMELDFADTEKYRNGEIIPTKEEADRLEKKYVNQ